MSRPRAAKPGMTEREHHAWGALLKYIEALTTAYRYDRYPKGSKTGKKFERFLTATRELREQLNHEYGWMATEHLIPKDYRDHKGCEDWWQARMEALRSDVYYAKEIESLHQTIVHEIENGPPDQALRFLGIPQPNIGTSSACSLGAWLKKPSLLHRFSHKGSRGKAQPRPCRLQSRRYRPRTQIATLTSGRPSSKTQINHKPRSSNSAAFTPIR